MRSVLKNTCWRDGEKQDGSMHGCTSEKPSTQQWEQRHQVLLLSRDALTHIAEHLAARRAWPAASDPLLASYRPVCPRIFSDAYWSLNTHLFPAVTSSCCPITCFGQRATSQAALGPPSLSDLTAISLQFKGHFRELWTDSRRLADTQLHHLDFLWRQKEKKRKEKQKMKAESATAVPPAHPNSQAPSPWTWTQCLRSWEWHYHRCCHRWLALPRPSPTSQAKATHPYFEMLILGEVLCKNTEALSWSNPTNGCQAQYPRMTWMFA